MSDKTVGYQVRYPGTRKGNVLDAVQTFSDRGEAMELFSYVHESFVVDGGAEPVLESRTITYGEWGAANKPAKPARLSREVEPPVGTWVKDKFGGTSFHQPAGWADPGFVPGGVWTMMWDARGPYRECGPWGAPLGTDR